jgi:hypothetical protein
VKADTAPFPVNKPGEGRTIAIVGDVYRAEAVWALDPSPRDIL